ncbi:tRNA (adenosine(37)-N6)-threonylcarbamoyltransferase complex dimerization subunit type 1 TsaB [Cellulomonas marina]|uniref:tRNA threonylcarbamoyladenosine biosynthesis protein TsaB n=1 Tax=Cellulomonas marina TaxID=988821 RepID=A0A1I0XR34_9CELL|nr:tRNA (adenosine(37)-N6)-threonylcarbamoyltransferase complex dimerization subunit type 1 TsaB [Cellulomonas marina]GIG30038.1 tRNA (adenosine(37)-N6)-threonylcarbamoyltransferase complex dimerization subunit type 1 TsaB [Cellulomonas marina]SFB03117.1 tRNA threonylcarbamoyladenosine biosynthesis protein TsaB [Cellulomonas marina]
MPVLALDTSAAVAVAVTDDAGTALAVRAVTAQRHHAELLAPLVAEALAAAGLTPRDLTALAVGTGPAPFTGLRVGLVTARTLGLALGLPVHGVPSLDALALRALEAAGAGGDDGDDEDVDVLAVTDARRREVYAGRYRRGPGWSAGASGPASDGTSGDPLLRVDGPSVGPAAALLTAGGDAPDAGRRVLVVGRGALTDPVLAEAAVPELAVRPELLDPDPVALARLALTRAAAGQEQPTEPLYLRRPDAVPPNERKRVLA